MISLNDIEEVYGKISRYINPTTMQNFPAVDAIVGNGIKIFFKPEILQPTKSFKVRNAFGGLVVLSGDEKKKGIIAASTGNLGQGLAYAGSVLGIPVTICVKKNNNPKKNEAIRGWGAKLVEYGDTYNEAHENAIRISEETELPYFSTSKRLYAFAGAATIGFEIFKEGIKIDRVVHSIGSGTHAAGTSISAKYLSPSTKIMGVQAVNASTIHDYWHNKTSITPVTDTIADAISLGRDFYAYSVKLLRDHLHQFTTVTEDEIINAIKMIYQTTGYIVEPAGAVGFAGVLANREQFSNESIAVILSGGNLSDTLKYLVE